MNPTSAVGDHQRICRRTVREPQTGSASWLARMRREVLGIDPINTLCEPATRTDRHQQSEPFISASSKLESVDRSARKSSGGRWLARGVEPSQASSWRSVRSGAWSDALTMIRMPERGRKPKAVSARPGMGGSGLLAGPNPRSRPGLPLDRPPPEEKGGRDRVWKTTADPSTKNSRAGCSGKRHVGPVARKRDSPPASRINTAKGTTPGAPSVLGSAGAGPSDRSGRAIRSQIAERHRTH